MISKKFAAELGDKEFRDAYVSAQTRSKISSQIRAIRESRGWSQSYFAERLGKPQSNVSRLENREYGSYTLNTLVAIAAQLDVSLVVEFTTFPEFVNRSSNLSPDQLTVPQFNINELEQFLDGSESSTTLAKSENVVQSNIEEIFQNLNAHLAPGDLNGRYGNRVLSRSPFGSRGQTPNFSTRPLIRKSPYDLPTNFEQAPIVAAPWATTCA